MIKNFKDFQKLNEVDEKMTSDEIINYIKMITPSDSDIPDYFFKLIRDSKKMFTKRRLNIDDILQKDPHAKEYVESGEERYGEYGESDYEPHYEEIDNPIVILNNEVMDGYSRLSTLKKMGEKTIDAYIA